MQLPVGPVSSGSSSRAGGLVGRASRPSVRTIRRFHVRQSVIILRVIGNVRRPTKTIRRAVRTKKIIRHRFWARRPGKKSAEHPRDLELDVYRVLQIINEHEYSVVNFFNVAFISSGTRLFVRRRRYFSSVLS